LRSDNRRRLVAPSHYGEGNSLGDILVKQLLPELGMR
jgi:hypothetical protein